MLELPNEVEKAEGLNPRDLVVISQPKMGKGTILGSFTEKYNAIVLDLEKGGYEYINARKISVYPSQETTVLEAYSNYVAWRNKLLENKGKYDYLIVDVLTELDKFSEIGGTMAYMYHTTTGKNFNKDIKTGQRYELGHPEFKYVTSLPDGAGFQHTRKWFMEQIEIFSQIAPYRIYAAHVADKYIKDAGKEEVVGSEISLTGKLKSIFSAKVTTLAKLVADGDTRYLSFDVANDSIIAGSRAPWLSGKIKISEKLENGAIETYWNNIYK